MEYDDLDIRINRLLSRGKMPVPLNELAPDMVEYYKTPARVVYELVERVRFGPEDFFFDLGSGLGQVVLLVNMLTGVRSRGVEIEPAFCRYAQRCAKRRGLAGVDFVEGDVRATDLSAGSVFYLFTPFRGEVLCAVLHQLRKVGLQGPVSVASYGPCSTEIARESWLKEVSGGITGVYDLRVFENK